VDKPRRDNLREVIQRVREAVEDSLQRQLVAYGMFRDAPPIPRDDLPLREEQKLLYERIRDAVLRQARAVGDDGVSPKAVDRYVREAGATWVNRLAALRALEERGLLTPAAAFVSSDYGGVSARADRLRERAAGEGRTLKQADALRAGIEDACRELSESVRVLFDLSDEQSLLWPDLKDVLRELSENVTPQDWKEPDVLGWVYQYYNAKANAELKKRKNKTTGFKYNPDDIPIANQFYTPHWVVRVLTDNTLGRLWLESRDRSPQATLDPWTLDERRQGIPNASSDPEAFRAWFVQPPDPLVDLTVDRLCRFLVPLPSRPLPRARKRVRDIKVLDPACGSGHFLLYAFDVLFAMYREDEPDTDPRQLPALILEHNLFGIDIDLRAAQLAAFDLYLKARTTLAAIDPDAKLELRGLNIVVADAHMGNGERKAAFLARYRSEPEIRRLYDRILTSLDHTNVLGSLLKVRTEFESLMGGARKDQSPDESTTFETPGQQQLLDVSRQRHLRDAFTSVSGRQWRIDDLLAELRRFERETLPAQDIGARLFYSDLERSVGLLALLSQSYDVVLMNPPYGDMPPAAKDYLAGNKKKKIEARYPRTAGDLYSAFMEQALDLLLPNGFLGALVPWTYMFLSSMEKVRTQLLMHDARPELLQEYGYGVLDGATVGTVGTIARRSPADREAASQHPAVFERLSDHKKDWEKQDEFLETFPQCAANGPNATDDWFVARLGSLAHVPGMPYAAYWASDSLRALFRRYAAMDAAQEGVLVAGRPMTQIADLRQGLATGDDPRFVRRWWEVPSDEVGEGKRWVPLMKGGASSSFLARTDLVVDWADDGAEIKEWVTSRYRQHWSKRVASRDYYFRPGVMWPARSWRVRVFGIVTSGAIFSHTGMLAFPSEHSSHFITGLMNSALLNGLKIACNPERKWEVGLVAGFPVTNGEDASIVAITHELVAHRRTRYRRDETYREATGPALCKAFRSISHPLDLDTAIRAVQEDMARSERDEACLLAQLDTATYEFYEITSEDRELIERELARRLQPGSAEPDEEEQGDDEDDDSDEDASDSVESGSELVQRWLSFYLKQVLESDPDGIVPVHATRTKPALIRRLMEVIEKELGREGTQRLLEQSPPYLGTKDVATWVEDGYFPWHVELYQKRPLFWLVSSAAFAKGKTRFTFQAFLHYLKLTPDTLPRLLTHYLQESIDHAQNQWNDAKLRSARAEGRSQKSARREAEEWLNTFDALESFKRALEGVIRGPAIAEKVPANAKWIARTIAAVRGGQDVGHGYRPDVDYGVKVNIKPLAEARLLPKSVLKKLGD
jgi:hypothetical protein